MDLGLIALVMGVFVVLALVRIIGLTKPPVEHGYRLQRSFLSPAERSFYGVLCSAIAGDYVVLAKVRVADVITPVKSNNRSTWQTAFNRISAKHFDFVLCDPKSLSVEQVVELHDRSHKNDKRAERDNFLRSACASAGLSLSEFVAKKSYSIEEVRNRIAQNRMVSGKGDGRVKPLL
mgnify:CR=1 FL=1